MPLECRVEALDKALFFEWLGQVTNCSRVKRSRTNALIGEGGEEDERHAVPLGKQVGLQLNAAHPGHLDICDHTRGVSQVARSQEIFRRRECIHDVSVRPHEAISRGAHGCIIVNDCDYGKFWQSDLP